MIYSSGLEMSQSVTKWNGRSISLSEGIPHRYTFSKKYPFIFYSYQISVTDKTLVLYFNLIDKSLFNINITIKKIPLRNATIHRNFQLFIRKEDLKNKCEKKEVCTVLISGKMKVLNQEKRDELIMYQIDSSPLYLERNVIKQDILHWNKVKHYYLEILKGEYIDITLDLKEEVVLSLFL